jgi:hypothetical protein
MIAGAKREAELPVVQSLVVATTRTARSVVTINLCQAAGVWPADNPPFCGYRLATAVQPPVYFQELVLRSIRRYERIANYRAVVFKPPLRRVG